MIHICIECGTKYYCKLTECHAPLRNGFCSRECAEKHYRNHESALGALRIKIDKNEKVEKMKTEQEIKNMIEKLLKNYHKEKRNMSEWLAITYTVETLEWVLGGVRPYLPTENLL